MFDLAIKNGHVIDPVNKISARLDLGISDGKIACLSSGPIKGAEEIDASGLIVTPGFVDIHIHEDPYDSGEDSFEFCISHTMLKMGVTTAVGGNCGITWGHKNPLAYLDAADEQGFPINIALLVPHDTLRAQSGVTDFYQKAQPQEVEEMVKRLQIFLNGGCVGFSIGPEYIPGTSAEELMALFGVAGRYQRVASAHIRYDAKKSVIALEEAIDAAQSGGTPLQISHIGGMCAFGQMERAISLIDAHKAKGMDLEFDCYPYYAFCTTIGSAVFDDGFLDDLGRGDKSYGDLEIASGTHRGERCTKESFEAVRKAEPDALVVAHLMDEKEVDLALSHPGCLIASDGLYKGGQGHPRGAGTFPRLIREYVLNKKMLSLEEAVRKITYAPAKRFGLEKGTLSVGADADVTIFDLSKIKDGATFMESTKEPSGIEYVILEGKTALKKGRIVNDRLGKSVRL